MHSARLFVCGGAGMNPGSVTAHTFVAEDLVKKKF
jgi:hypothetical protein